MQVASTDLAAVLTAAIAGGYVAETTGQTFTVTQPIVINVNSTIQGPLGIDLGGAHIVSQITNGAPIIQINVGPGVDLRYLTFSNFTIDGNGREGDGIRIVAAGNDRWVYNFTVDNVTVRNVGGYGLDVQGSVFEGLVSNSSMIGNAQGGAYFSHFSAGQVSALRWFGGSFEHNGGAGLILANGARDISVDNVSFTANGGVGISAEQGITSVTDSRFTDNSVAGIWFQNFGNFSGNTFVNSGVQATGITGWLNGGASVIDNTSIYSGAGSDPTVLANLQGFGQAFMEGDVGRTVTGANIAVSGVGGGNSALLTVGNQGVALPALAPITAATTAALADSTGTGTLETALRSALANGTVGDLSGASFTVSSTIVINLTTSKVMPTGIDLGGAKILSQITNGAPVIEIIVGAGVDIAALKLANFLIAGNGREGDGIRIVADGADRSVRLDISGVNVEHVGGIGLDAIGNVSGTVFDSWMHGNLSGGARFADSAGGGTADGLQWIGGGFRKNGVAGLILDNGAHDMTVQGAYFVENDGPGIDATRGITLIEQSGFENNNGVGALVQGAATFVDTTFSTWGVQQTAIGGYLAGQQQITMIATGSEYYGANPDNTVLANIQGTGTLALAGGGKVIASAGMTMNGLADLTTAQLPHADSLTSHAINDAFVLVDAEVFNSAELAGLLANDRLPSGGLAALASAPSHGEVTLRADGAFSYEAAHGFTGIDSFTYKISSGGADFFADATILVVPHRIGTSNTLDFAALTPSEQMAANYVAFFNRAPDKAGFDFWVDQFERGLPTQGPSGLLANVANSFGAGTEAKTLYPLLANPVGSSDAQIVGFLNSVYDNLFNRAPDAGGLAYWVGAVKQSLASATSVGPVLVEIIEGAQNTPAGQDITVLMSKVAVSLEYVKAQESMSREWTWADDHAGAMAVLASVTSAPETVLTGIKNAYELVHGGVT